MKLKDVLLIQDEAIKMNKSVNVGSNSVGGAALRSIVTGLNNRVSAGNSFVSGENCVITGVNSVAIGKGRELKITFDVNEMLMNPQGALHGGVMATVMDISMGHLLNKAFGNGATIEMKVQYLRPVREGNVTCEARFLKKGRTLSFMESRLSDQAGKLAAVATATWKMPD